MDNKDEKEIKKVTRKKKENNENEIKEKLKIEENKPLEKEVFKETKKDVINKNSNKTIIIIVVTALITTAIVLSMFYLFYINKAGTSGKLEFVKNVNITETGIADSVEKVVDSVVVVENYKNGKLISTGTGFVFKKDNKTSYILTNSHVVESGTEYNVIFTNNERVKATLVGNDTYSDVAVLSVDSSKVISVATLGSSESLRVGDTAFTVGAPLDASAYSWTVTRGIISGKNRKVEVSSASSSFVMNVLQTDAPINSGNSGGPLCNVNGEVIGITNMKISNTTVEGMGFAIPIEKAITKAEQIISGESYEYPYLGIQMLDITDAYSLYQYYDLIKSSGLSSGVLVASIEKGSPASKAKFETNDIITKIDGNEVKNLAYLRYYLYQHKVGDTIKVTVYRDGKTKELSVTLGTNKQTT